MDQAVLERAQLGRTSGGAANSRGRIDTLLERRIQRALEDTGHQPLRELGVMVEDGEVVLRGRLPSYYLTQLALTKAMRVEGVARVRNEIHVN